MSGLLPSPPSLSTDRETAPRIVGLESEDASDLLAALSSDTARALFCALYEEPSTPSELADRVGTSLQNAQYHLENLESADLIEAVGTQYSEKGREMTIYAAANGPLVVHPGKDDELGERLLSRFVGGVVVIGFVALLLEGIARAWFPGLDPTDATATDDVAVEQLPPTTGDPHWLVAAVTELPPGLLFFVGGVLVLAIVIGIWYRRGALVR